ncbi:MAG: hypothetical protein FWG08_00565 [Propionibacteriaceae bacterium]|nr:hypothetical protein [Propionibacteriaceae bacterium]
MKLTRKMIALLAVLLSFLVVGLTGCSGGDGQVAGQDDAQVADVDTHDTTDLPPIVGTWESVKLTSVCDDDEEDITGQSELVVDESLTYRVTHNKDLFPDPDIVDDPTGVLDVDGGRWLTCGVEDCSYMRFNPSTNFLEWGSDSSCFVEHFRKQFNG